MNRPNLTIHATSMLRAQEAKLTATQRKQINRWADDVEARRLARGIDAEDARPDHFDVPVLDSRGAPIGTMTYTI